MFKIDDALAVYFLVEADDSGRCFNSPGQLLALADRCEWSRETMESIWNLFAGTPRFEKLKPVKKFRNRPFAAQRIWDEIQRLKVGGSEESPKRQKRKTISSDMPVKTGTKAAELLRLIQRERGASISEIMEALDWQAHSVRGAVSTLQSKRGIAVATEKSETRGLVYKIAA